MKLSKNNLIKITPNCSKKSGVCQYLCLIFTKFRQKKGLTVVKPFDKSARSITHEGALPDKVPESTRESFPQW